MCLDKRSKSQTGGVPQDTKCSNSTSKDSMTVTDQSIERMCLDKQQSETKTGGMSDDAKDSVSNYKGVMMVKDAEHSSPSCSSSEADLSDAYKQEVNENGQCPLCSEIFLKPSEFTLHLKKHTDGTKCLVCGKVLSSANSLDRHLLVHSGEKPFECDTCGKAFTTNGNMNRHKKKRKHFKRSSPEPSAKKVKKVPNDNEMSNSTPVSTRKEKMHDCEKCSDRFLNLAITSLPTNFDLVSRMDCERRKSCPLNKKEIDKSSDDVEHLEVCNSCSDLCLRIANLHSEEGGSKELYLCDYCGAGFISNTKFQIHKEFHEMSEQHHIMNVDIRNKEDKDSFLQKLGLLNAKKMDNILSQKEGSEYKEEPVNFENPSSIDSASSYPNDGSLQILNASTTVSLSSKPSRNVTSPVSADCAPPASAVSQAPASPIGGSTVSKGSSTTDKKLQCKQCGECFSSEKLSAIHSCELHLKKKIKCAECDYECKDKSTLKRHMRTHTGERPFICKICRKDFPTMTNTKRHLKNTHRISNNSKTYIENKCYDKNSNTKCPRCKQDFGDPQSLNQHLTADKQRCPGKEFVCSECSQRFSTKNNCLRHMRKIHRMKKNKAQESVITDKFDSGGNRGRNEKLQRIELILDAAGCEIPPANSNLETATQEQNTEKNENCTNDKENLPIISEIESNAAAIDMCKNSSKLENATNFLYPSIDTVLQRPSSIEVAVSYSMLKLSEELPRTQKSQEKESEEASRTQEPEPLDLSIRALDLSSKVVKSKQNSKEINSSISSQSITPPPAHTSPLAILKNSSRNFREHFVELPRPINSHISRTNKIIVSPVSDFVKQNAAFNTSFVNNTEDSSGSERELRIIEDPVSEVSSENILIPVSSRKQYASDSEVNDLAEVAAIIDTSNSQVISQFLQTVTFGKSCSAVAELGTLNIVPETKVSKNKTDNKKKMLCHQCNKSFSNSSALKRHSVIHSNEKLYTCSICSKAFNAKSNCKRHEINFHSRKSAKTTKNSSAEHAKTQKNSSDEHAKATKDSSDVHAKATKDSSDVHAKATKDSSDEYAKTTKHSSAEHGKAPKHSSAEYNKGPKHSSAEYNKGPKHFSAEQLKAPKVFSGEHRSTSYIRGSKADFSKFRMTNQMSNELPMSNDPTNELPQNYFDRAFYSDDRFFNMRHMKSTYNNVPFSEKDFTVKPVCKLCLATCKNLNDLWNHVEQIHSHVHININTVSNFCRQDPFQK